MTRTCGRSWTPLSSLPRRSLSSPCPPVPLLLLMQPFIYRALIVDRVSAVRPGYLLRLPAAGSLSLNCVMCIINGDVSSALISIKIPFGRSSPGSITAVITSWLSDNIGEKLHIKQMSWIGCR